MPRMQKQRHR